MKKEEVLAGLSISELRDEIYKRQDQENLEKYGTKKEVPFNISEVESLEAEGDGSLFHVRVEDGCEGWECIVEVDRSVRDADWTMRGGEEELVERHIINFMVENNYYEDGYIEDIKVEEICRYSRPIFKIYTDE